MGTVAVFIDGAYLDKILQNEFSNVRVAHDQLAQQLIGQHELLRAYYYDSPPYQSTPPTEREREMTSNKQRFFSALNRLPHFEVRLGKCAMRHDNSGGTRYEQKRVDILMAVDLVLLAVKQRITHAALITGDSDLLPAINIARNEGVVVGLYHGEQYHNELWDACDDRMRFNPQLIQSITRHDS